MTPAEDVRRIARHLRSPQGTLAPTDRLMVMRRLLDTAERAQRFGGAPDTDCLTRLAAHSLVWAEQSGPEAPE